MTLDFFDLCLHLYDYAGNVFSRKGLNLTKIPQITTMIEFRRDYSLGESLSGFALEIVPSLLSMIILGVLSICS
jgi:hypothetical protein